jgi:two-component system, cell cycle response regulator DivK
MADETILIVEDSPLNRKLVETVLSPHGYHLLDAKNGEEAIEVATREHPDLILMDMKMPKLDGYEATRILKSRPDMANVPIVALTAHAMEEERERAIQSGCDGYITKPINTRTFPSLVRQYLDQ